MCGDKNRINVNRIDVYYENVEELNINLDILEKQVRDIINSEKKELGDIAIIFCNDDYLFRLNEEYLNHNYFTDIITFDYCKNSLVSGDLFLSIERIADNADKYGTTFKKELYRVIFHGILHLVGYNDKTSVERTSMRKKENYYLKGMDFDKESI